MNLDVINQVLILFIIILFGIFARKKGYINEEVSKGLSSILMNITLPLLIISSFIVDYSKDILVNSAWMFFYSIIINLILMIIAKFIFMKFKSKEKNILKFLTVFSNCGFMGFPILEGLFGKTAVFYGSIFNVTFNLFIFTYGIMLFTHKKDLKAIKKIAINPVIICTIIGFLIFRFSINLPFVIEKSVNMVGSMTTPISMLIIGAMLAENNIRKAFRGYKIYLVSFLRLILAPIITLIVLRFLGADDTIIKTLVIIEAMPSAATAAVFAEQYGGDKDLISKCIFITTLFSICTIPLISQLL